MYKPDYLMMTPGPSIVRQNVMERRAEFFVYLYHKSITKVLGGEYYVQTRLFNDDTRA